MPKWLPFTEGDARQFISAALLAIGTAVAWNLQSLVGHGLREIDWADFAWELGDNMFQALITYLIAWWGLTKSGIVRRQQVTPASEVRPQSEPVIEQIPPAGPPA